MSQALASLSRNLIPGFICIVLAACNGSYTAFESDRDFDTDQKTADIEQDNAELMTLAAYQSAFLGHYQTAAYLFLDASDLPIDADLPIDEDPNAIEKKFQQICTNGGTAVYGYSKESGEAHKVGDSISVVYKKCLEGDIEYNGTMTGTYSKLRGLNDRFVTIGTEQCLIKLQENLNVKNIPSSVLTFEIENDYYLINGDEIVYPGTQLEPLLNSARVVSVPGDDINYRRVGNTVVADILSVEVLDNGEGAEGTEVTVDLSFTINEDQTIIFVLRPKELKDDMVTSIDGDQLFSVIGLEDKAYNCQNYERTLSVRFTDFSTNKADYLSTSLSGRVTLLDSAETANRVNQSFIDSDFTTTVVQGSSTEVYTMKSYNVEQAINKTDDTYSYEFDGFISNQNMLNGQVALTATDRLLGSFASQYPKAGALEMKAKGLERVYLVPDNLNILLRVDFNGDSTGNGFGDFDIFINTTWSELFAREFKEG